MKKLILFALVLSVFSCKTEEPAPILSDVVSGSFTATIVKIQGLPISVPLTLNGQTTSAVIKATKKTETSVSAILTVTIKDSKGTTDTPNDQGEFTLSGDGKTTVNVLKDGVLVGTYTVATKTLVITAKTPNPLDGNKITNAEITAVKM